jgi:hypothetical protein
MPIDMDPLPDSLNVWVTPRPPQKAAQRPPPLKVFSVSYRYSLPSKLFLHGLFRFVCRLNGTPRLYATHAAYRISVMYVVVVLSRFHKKLLCG